MRNSESRLRKATAAYDPLLSLDKRRCSRLSRSTRRPPLPQFEQPVVQPRRSQRVALMVLRFRLLTEGQHRIETSTTFSKLALLAPSRANVDMP